MELWDIYDKDRNLTGKIIKRGDSMKSNEYHLVAHVWIRNKKGEFLITKRTANKSFPHMWESPGGAASSGESSYDAAIRETLEEIGLDLSSSEGSCIISDRREPENFPSNFRDVWLFECDAEINDLKFQEDEVCDAMWATKEKIQTMIKEKTFIGHFQYLDQLFNIK